MGAGLLALVAVAGMDPSAVAQTPPDTRDLDPAPVHAFVQAGSGLTELAHAEAGVFLGAHLTFEAMVAWEGVFGGRYGSGLMYAFGQAQGRRPPRNALLVGARVMLNASASFDSGGDDLSSYVLIPVGYGYLAESGFYLRATLAPVVGRKRTDLPRAPGDAIRVDHHWTVGGPMINLAAGLAF